MKNYFLKICLIIFGLSANINVSAQSFSNEWINSSKEYIKIRISEDGIYRVSYKEIAESGITSQTFKGSDLQMINFGQEVAIFVSNDNEFGENDYLEFYGEKHRIGLDSFLYNDWRTDLFNTQYSLVNDTNAYFLTLSPETTNKRFKAVNNDISSFTGSAFQYYIHKESQVFENTYFKNVDGDTRYSFFEPSEGFGSGVTQNSTVNLNTSLYVPSGPQPQLQIRGGCNSQLQKIRINLNNELLDSFTLLPKRNIQSDYLLSTSQLKNLMSVNVRNLDVNDRHRLASISVIYPRAFNFNNSFYYKFSLDANAEKRLLEISSFKSNGNPVILYDITRNIKYQTNSSAGEKVTALVDGSDSDTDYIIFNEDEGIKKIGKTEVFNPLNLSDTNIEYLIISNSKLYEDGTDYVSEYSTYRSSPEGGNFKTGILDVQNIYDHFGYGINRHFQGFKFMSEYMKTQWPNLKYVIILGKAVEYPTTRTENDLIGVLHRSFFVPTFGYPGSDNMLFSEGNYPDPAFAIGRIAAISGEEVKIYLDKIKEYDQAPLNPQTIEDKYWMKRTLHLGGGNTVPEQDAIKNSLLSMQGVLENSMLGSDVRTFYKTSTDVLQSATSSQIKDLISTGVSLITFFGHSGVGTFDFSLENPREYKNAGKYPIINSLGCYSGNIHTPQKGISEAFVLEKDRGAIGFLASSGTAFIGSLSLYGREFYDNIGNTYFGENIGTINQIVLKKYRESLFSNLAFYQQLTYHGDPAVKVYSSNGPDYVFDYNSVKTIPALISSNTKEFHLSFDIVNLGKLVEDSLELRFEYQLPSGKLFDTVMTIIQTPKVRETYTIKLTNAGVEGIGKNTIFGYIDPKNDKDEMPAPGAKNNNQLENNSQKGYSFYILDNTAFPVYPDDYAIVSSNDLTLQVSASNAFIEKTKYLFEIDTTALFNSPLKIREEIVAEGGLIGWKPTVNYVPNTVYYWRVSPDSINPEVGYLWQQSSFIYIPNSLNGWNQSHYYQLIANNGEKLVNLDSNREYKFPEDEIFIQMRNELHINEVTGFKVNLGVRYSSILPWAFTSGGAVCFVIQDGNLNSPQLPGGIQINNGGDFQSVFFGAHATRRNYTFYTNTPQERKKVIDFIENHIPTGKYVTFFTVMNKADDNVYADQWAGDEALFGKSILSLLEAEGANSLGTLAENGTVPYIFMFQKGIKPIVEKIATSPLESIETQMGIPVKGSKGILKTIHVSNVSTWDKIIYKLSDKEVTDTILLRVIGVYDDLSENILADSLDVTEFDLSPYSANLYPSMRFELHMRDNTKMTAPKVDYIRVYFTELPDIALDPTSLFKFYKDSLDQGDLFKVDVAVKNLSKIKTDSIDIKYSLINLENNAEVVSGQVYRKLNESDTIHISFRYDTRNLAGEYLFVSEANYKKRFTEKYYFNNIGKKSFKVKKDNKNPLLDIYFDGIRIMDGDIVSPMPEIKIVLQDDNQYIPVTNAEQFEIRLDTGRNQIKTITMDDVTIKFTPSTSSSEPATLQYFPKLKTGEYKLMVQGYDMSGNKSGKNDKVVSFRVIEEESVTNVLNYPNPFSTSTQFIFTLTGSEIPDIMSISIMTMSGKVVREITKEELGPLRIGVNRTEYKWDGRDEYGSKLGNGVYLYKVNIRKSNGEKYDSFDNSKVDNFFNSGYGKLVIMR
ncbi:MAG: hypothetical protein IPM42_10475 [Saprospiraceae bacterium]|nr:hypothetical protein [Saprospiraceae bacterium]